MGLTSITSHIHNWALFSLSLHLVIVSVVISPHIGHLPTWVVSYLFALSYCSWGSQGNNTQVVCHSLLQWTSSHHYLQYLHHSLASGQITRREHSPAFQQKIGLKIYWAWPRPSEQDPVSSSVSLSHQEPSISLLSFSIRGQADRKPQWSTTQP